MHNVSVGDIFTSSTEVYRVVEVLENEECSDDPLFVVELLVSGSGFVLDDISLVNSILMVGHTIIILEFLNDTKQVNCLQQTARL